MENENDIINSAISRLFLTEHVGALIQNPSRLQKTCDFIAKYLIITKESDAEIDDIIHYVKLAMQAQCEKEYNLPPAFLPVLEKHSPRLMMLMEYVVRMVIFRLEMVKSSGKYTIIENLIRKYISPTSSNLNFRAEIIARHVVDDLDKSEGDSAMVLYGADLGNLCISFNQGIIGFYRDKHRPLVSLSDTRTIDLTELAKEFSRWNNEMVNKNPLLFWAYNVAVDKFYLCPNDAISIVEIINVLMELRGIIKDKKLNRGENYDQTNKSA